MMMEQIKRNPDEFGGLQVRLLTENEMLQRLCARRFCSSGGHIQISIPFETPPMYRIFCKRHFVMLMMVSAAAMGDPSPVGEAQRISDVIGFDWKEMSSIEPLHLITPDSFVCSICGGRLMSETAGMYKGLRWIHTCGEPKHFVEE